MTSRTILALRYSPFWYRYLFDEDVRIVFVMLPGEARRLPDRHRAEIVRSYEVSSFDSIEQMAAVAADLRLERIAIDAIASPTEATQYAAGLFADWLDLDSTSSELIARTRDKRLMKVLAEAAGVDTPRWTSVPDLGRGTHGADVIAATGLPLVLKPANGWGATSTYRVDDEQALQRLLDDYPLDSELRSGHLIAEEFIAGTELHVDAVWHEGEPQLLCVSRYFKPLLTLWTDGGVNGSYVLPRPEHEELYKRIEDLHARLNQAFGITSGATHLELFREAGTDRLVLTEIASRPGGGNIAEMIGAYCGVDLRAAWARELAGGRVDSMPDMTNRAYVAMLNLAPATAGVIIALPDAAMLADDPAVLAVSNVYAVGDRIEVKHPSAWCTLLVVAAPTEAELTIAVERIIRDHPVTVRSLES